MENSILTSTKKILGLSEEYTPFDHDVIIHINACLSVLSQIGIGPEHGVMIEDETAQWGDLGLDTNRLNLVRTYVFLRTKMLFDPPTTSFLIEAMERQIAQLEWRLNVLNETET
jgi:hypothetical protein